MSKTASRRQAAARTAADDRPHDPPTPAEAPDDATRVAKAKRPAGPDKARKKTAAIPAEDAAAKTPAGPARKRTASAKKPRRPSRKTFLVAATQAARDGTTALHVYAAVTRSPAEALAAVRAELGPDVAVELTGKLSNRMAKSLGLKPGEVRPI